MADIKLEKNFLDAKKKLFEKEYGFLNERQREAVLTVNGPLLVLAGAGTGKTTVLVNRIAHIIRYGNAYENDSVPDEITESEVKRLEDALTLSKEEISEILDDFVTSPCPPWNILCFTFTNKAAGEMKERLASILGEEVSSGIWAGTFHSICIRLLRKFGDVIGYGGKITIYDTDDSKKTVQQCMKDLNIDEKSLPIKTVVNEISRSKDALQGPDDYFASSRKGIREFNIAKIYSAYQQKLVSACAMDFDDIIMQTVRLLETSDEAKSYCSNKFRYISVDEFQDTNLAQLRLIELLSEKNRNLMVVGDDDQSIYKFRGATIENILNFDREYSDAKVIKLEENYRSTSNILGAANNVIAHNRGRHEKELFTKAGKGAKITVKTADSEIDEARYIANKINDLSSREKKKYSDFAILYRMNSQSNSIEKVLSRFGIPHRIYGGTKFYERKEIKDIIAYLTILSNPADDLRLKRIINEPKRKIGEKLISDIETIAAANGKTMMEIVRSASLYPQICKFSAKLDEFVNLIDELTEIMTTQPLHILFEHVINDTGYRDMLVLGGELDAERVENVDELISNAIEFENERDNPTLDAFLEEVTLMSDIDNYDSQSDAVVLMTVHSAKGMEFPVVFIPGLEESIFPSTRNADEEDDIEEERRLAYVAYTRAKEKLFLIHTNHRLLFGSTRSNQPSRFITEIPDAFITCEDGIPQTITSFGYSVAPKKYVSPVFTSPAAVLGQGANSPKKEISKDRFRIGDRVSHQNFGEGTVMSAKDLGSDVIYEIAFDDAGTKKLMGTYARLKKCDEKS